MKLKNLINLLNSNDSPILSDRKFIVYLDGGESEYEGDFADWKAIRDYLGYEVESATDSGDQFIIVLRGDDSAARIFDENSSLINEIQSIEMECNSLRKDLRKEKAKNAKCRNLLNSLRVTIGDKLDETGKAEDHYVQSGGIWETIEPKAYENAYDLAINLCDSASPMKNIGGKYHEWELKF